MLARVGYEAAKKIKLTHPGRTNQMSNVSYLPQEECVFQPGSDTSGSEAVRRLVLKNTVRIEHIIRKFIVSGELVADCCAGMFSVAKAYMLLPQHKQFVGCDLVLKCVSSSFSHLTLVFARLVLNKTSDTTADEVVQ